MMNLSIASTGNAMHRSCSSLGRNATVLAYIWRKLAIVVVTTSLCMLAQQVARVDAKAYWGGLTQDDCIVSGYRKYYARLWGIDGDWMEACAQAENWIHSVYYRSPDRCVDKGILGMWGEWHVQDSSCDPNWGQFQDDGCRDNGCRRFSAVIYDVPSGVSWEDWCWGSWADINNQHFDSPSNCVNAVLHMWGQFFLRDPICGFCNPKQAVLADAHHGDLGGLAGRLSPSNSPSSSPPEASDSPFSSLPSDVNSPSGSPWNQ